MRSCGLHPSDRRGQDGAVGQSVRRRRYDVQRGERPGFGVPTLLDAVVRRGRPRAREIQWAAPGNAFRGGYGRRAPCMAGPSTPPLAPDGAETSGRMPEARPRFAHRPARTDDARKCQCHPFTRSVNRDSVANCAIDMPGGQSVMEPTNQRPVVVVDHQTTWAAQFEAEAAAIHRALAAEVVYIHHIGSTAVLGLSAKPIIDILPVVRDVSALDGAGGAAMARLGYTARGEYGLAGRRLFVKADPRTGTHRTHVHAYQVGHPAVARHLAFRDFLRHRPAVAAEYGRLKADLAAQHPEDIEAYMDGKDAFVKAQERQALAWWSTVPLVLVTGPVGVGKTTVASALADALVDEGIPTAFVDGDALTEVHPASPGDEMGEGVLLANLEAAWGVYRAAGARCLVLAQVVESEAAIRPFVDAIPGADVTVIRLDAPLDVIHQRIAQRGAGESDPWHLERAQGLHALYRRTPLGHVTLDAVEPVSVVVERALAATRVMERLVTPPG